MDVGSVDVRVGRCVLQGVPRLSFEPKPELDGDVELTPFPSAVHACLRAIGDDINYPYLMGMTGDAFRLSWKEGWHPDNVADIYTSPDAATPCRLAFRAAGRDFETIGSGSGSVPRPLLVEHIVRSIRDLGRPVIGYGLVGPPEACVITGYDEDGAVLVGWSFFQSMPEFNPGVEFEPSGYFRKRDWYPELPAITLIGERRERPPKEERYREALQWALEVMRTPSFFDPKLHGPDSAWRDRHNGHAAYAAWARHLLRDEDFPSDNLIELVQRHGVQNDATTVVAEGRWYASVFLGQAAQALPHCASKLHEAAAHCAREHELMWAVWGCLGGNERGEKQIRALADPGVRRAIVPLILEARDLDVAAARCIEEALAMPKLW